MTKNDYTELWEVKNVYNFFLNKDCVLAGLVRNQKNVLIDLVKGSIFKEFDFDLNIRGKRTNSYYYGSTYLNSKPVILKYCLKKNELNDIFDSPLGISAIKNDNEYISDNSTVIFNNSFINNQILWQFNISQFGSYIEKSIYKNEPSKEKEREINRIYFHNNKIIVTLSRAIIAIEPTDGKLIWKIDFESYDPVNLIFNENTAYSGRLIHYAVIDIEKGIKLFENTPSQIIFKNYKLGLIRYVGLTFFNNHIWFTYDANGQYFLVMSKPENGEIVDIMLLETKVATHPPIFDENRLYLLNQSGELYIYEEPKL